ncbi:HNH endonuclease signature motif containing protein [Pelagibacterium mangrovi]|uniref:HNH endonuclease signature motif containing protein n=1 Tax=Pelagibacterium mangrovi TaxID=3119828 RepID=UPI002FCACDBC
MIARDRERKARFDEQRPTARARGYDSRWQQARAEYLKAHPHCSHPGCTATATVVDHIIPHRGDRKLFWDRKNWSSLCQHHHSSAKQSMERRG